MAPTDHDRTIHNSATGAAYTTTITHRSSASTGFTLYSGWFCPFVQRVWLLLEEKSIPYRYIEINPYHKEAHFLELNPRGLVPTLSIAEPTSSIKDNDVTGEVNGTPVKEKVLYESTVILDYLEQTHPSPSFYPEDPYDKAVSKIWMDHVGTRIVPCFYRFLQHTPEKSYSLDEARHEFTQGILTLVKAMSSGEEGPWFGGREMSMVDIMLIPWALRVFLIDYYKTPGGSGVPLTEGRVDEVSDGDGEKKRLWGRWVKWYQAVEGRESVKRTMSERGRYVDVYKRYAEDTTGSQVGNATRGGRGLP